LDSGAFTTFWNLKGNKQFQCSKDLTTEFGPYVNLVGVPRNMPLPNMRAKLTKTWLVDKIDPTQMGPANLYEAQKAVRMKSPNKVSGLLGGKGAGGKKLSSY
jgi:hypothetical protein